MGKYINEDSNGNILGASAMNKVLALVDDGAFMIPQPIIFKENIVCVVDNGPFAAAAYCYSQDEFDEFTRASDVRPKIWLSYEHAAALAKG